VVFWPLRFNMKLLQFGILFACITAGQLPGAEPAKAPAEKAAPAKAFKNVGVDEFDKLRTDKGARVLDVRTPKEFASGHMTGAINIDINAPDFQQKVSALEKDKTYLVHCAAGVRSARACGQMSRLHFQNLYNLEGGFKAWEKAGKPVEKNN
jgi:rhodanese-related sulfurtransferase